MEIIDPIVRETNNFCTMFTACDEVRVDSDMISIVAPSGYGKTTASTCYYLKNKKNVVLIKALKSQSPSIFYCSLLNAISTERYSYNLHRHWAITSAAELFNNQEEKMLLIIDEANNFSSSMLEYLHEFRDMTKGRLGIILAGTIEFKTKLESWVTKGKSGIPEFYGRISSFQYLFPPTKDEIDDLIEAYGIDDMRLNKLCYGAPDFRQITNRIKNYKKKMRNR